MICWLHKTSADHIITHQTTRCQCGHKRTDQWWSEVKLLLVHLCSDTFSSFIVFISFLVAAEDCPVRRPPARDWFPVFQGIWRQSWNVLPGRVWSSASQFSLLHLQFWPKLMNELSELREFYDPDTVELMTWIRCVHIRAHTPLNLEHMLSWCKFH